MKLNGYDKRYELICSTFQLSIILLFNNSDTLKIEDIREMTNINYGVLEKELHPLFEQKLLVKEGNLIHVNQKFTQESLNLNTLPIYNKFEK